jgi:hypothetical protein
MGFALSCRHLLAGLLAAAFLAGCANCPHRAEKPVEKPGSAANFETTEKPTEPSATHLEDTKPATVASGASSPRQDIPADTDSQVLPIPAIKPAGFVAARPGDQWHGAAFQREGNVVTMVGRLEYLYVRDIWRFHYESNGVGDPFGGSVTIPPSYLPTKFPPGQLVRIEGQIVDKDGSRRLQLWNIQEVAAR